MSTNPALRDTAFRLRCLQGGTLALFAIQVWITLPLWGVAHDYPLIPLFGLLTSAPAWSEWLVGSAGILAAVGIVAGLLGAGDKLRRGCWLGLAVCLLLMFGLDQHRLQVWAWQVVLMGICFAGLRERDTAAWLRLLTIAIYFYSAVSKVDVDFLQSYGQTLLKGVFDLLPGGEKLAFLPPSRRMLLAGLFPVGELLVAGLLCFRRTRYFGWIGSLLLHLGLIATLGPWGLNHHPPVLIWNFFFLFQNTLLFTGPEALLPVAAMENSQPVSRRERLTEATLLLAVLFPVSEWFNRGDVWPSWGLYAARGARVRLYLAPETARQLPNDMQPFLQGGGEYRHLDLHRWSFDLFTAPSYPQDRYQFAVATTILNRLSPEAEFTLTHESTANRWTGKRTKTTLTSREELEAFASRFALNLQPRLESRITGW